MKDEREEEWKVMKLTGVTYLKQKETHPGENQIIKSTLTFCTILEIVINAHETVFDEFEVMRDLIDEGGETRHAVRDHRLRTTKDVFHQLFFHLEEKISK